MYDTNETCDIYNYICIHMTNIYIYIYIYVYDLNKICDTYDINIYILEICDTYLIAMIYLI